MFAPANGNNIQQGERLPSAEHVFYAWYHPTLSIHLYSHPMRGCMSCTDCLSHLTEEGTKAWRSHIAGRMQDQCWEDSKGEIKNQSAESTWNGFTKSISSLSTTCVLTRSWGYRKHLMQSGEKYVGENTGGSPSLPFYWMSRVNNIEMDVQGPVSLGLKDLFSQLGGALLLWALF